MKENEVFKTY